MKDKLLHIIRTKPVFLFLLPVFFVLHGLLEYFNPTLIRDALLLLLIYSCASLFIASLFWILYHNINKAALAAFSIMSCNFFFGNIYDFLKKIFSTSFITRFSFIIPAILVMILFVAIYLKKSKYNYYRTSRYLNTLLLLLILFDSFSLASKLINRKGTAVSNLSHSLKKIDTCSKPDIYLIIADEYAGKTELKDLFSFDNSSFENELQTRGFHIINNSSSNYNATVYSMASMLNMDYLKTMNNPSLITHRNMLMCRSLIKKNNLASFLQQNGYSIYNHSFFDVADKKKAVRNFFFPTNRSLLTYQTFVNRFIYYFGSQFASKQEIIDINKNDLYNNIKIDSLTRKTVMQTDSKPKFVYAHLNMPHNPYFFDSSGKEILVNKLSSEPSMKGYGYIGYLQYSNTKLLNLVDFIKKNSASPPVIFLMGDHGYKQFTPGIEKKHYFMNLNAVYFPNGNYSGFYDSMSNVNQFRVTLNTIFGQQLPLLKDSISFLRE